MLSPDTIQLVTTLLTEYIRRLEIWQNAATALTPKVTEMKVRKELNEVKKALAQIKNEKNLTVEALQRAYDLICEGAVIEAKESGELISRDEAYEVVCDNPPERSE